MKRVSILLNGNRITEVGLADRYFLRLRGLIGRDPAKIGGLLIRPCGQIHTCFMSCPIDVIYLKKDGTVLQVDEALPAYRFFKPVRGAKSVLELSAGKAAEYGITSGAVIKAEKKKNF